MKGRRKGMETGKEGRRQGARKEGRQERREEEKGKERKQKKKKPQTFKNYLEVVSNNLTMKSNSKNFQVTIMSQCYLKHMP